MMTAYDNYRFDEKVSISLRMDEAVALFWYLSREVWNRGSARLEGTFDHPAEHHSVQALLQELAARLIHTGGNEASQIEQAARESVMHRYASHDGSGK
jgi:hypothetical protein